MKSTDTQGQNKQIGLHQIKKHLYSKGSDQQIRVNQQNGRGSAYYTTEGGLYTRISRTPDNNIKTNKSGKKWIKEISRHFS